MKNITDEVSERCENLTEPQKIIAGFLLENYALVSFGTLSEIACRIRLSTTSLIHFPRTTGYRGYTDLKKNMQDLIKVKVSLPSRFGELSEQGGIPNNLLLRCRDTAVNSIEATLRLQDTERLDLAVDWISSVSHNYVLGLRACFFPAFYLAVVLSQIEKKARPVQGIASTYPEEITDAEEGGMCTVFLFPRFYKETVNIAHFVRRGGTRVIITTGKDIRPVKPYGDIIIPYSAIGPSLKDSCVAVHFLVGYIISSVAVKNKDEGIEVVSKVEEILSQNYFTGF